MGRRLLAVLAVTCAVGVANLYFPQAVSPLIADELGTSPDAASLVVTAVQLGYTAGIFLLVPLGDRLRHRPFLVTLLACTGLALLAAGAAPTLPFLVAASALVGITTVAAQVVAPMAAGLVASERRGAAMGALMSGSIGGILLARTFGGTLGEWLGWRAPYLVAAVVVLLLAAVLARTVPSPAAAPLARRRYGALLAESLRLLRSEPELRRSCFNQAAVFAGFSAIWTCLALLLAGPVYGLGGHAVGLIALAGGVVTMLCMPFAGRLVDRLGPDRVNLVCLLGVLVATAVLAVGGLGGALGLATLTLGTLLLDLALQAGMVANQTRVFAVRADARSRLNTAYMTCVYLGGSVGSWLGVQVYGRIGWPGVSALVVVLAAIALARHAVAIRRSARPACDRSAEPPVDARRGFCRGDRGG